MMELYITGGGVIEDERKIFASLLFVGVSLQAFLWLLVQFVKTMPGQKEVILIWNYMPKQYYTTPRQLYWMVQKCLDVRIRITVLYPE